MPAASAERTAQIKVQVVPRLHRAVRIRAAEEGVSISRYVTELLERDLLAKTDEGESRR